jgi:hypothetical protein
MWTDVTRKKVIPSLRGRGNIILIFFGYCGNFKRRYLTLKIQYMTKIFPREMLRKRENYERDFWQKMEGLKLLRQSHSRQHQRKKQLSIVASRPVTVKQRTVLYTAFSAVIVHSSDPFFGSKMTAKTTQSWIMNESQFHKKQRKKGSQSSIINNDWNSKHYFPFNFPNQSLFFRKSKTLKCCDCLMRPETEFVYG